MSRTIKSNKRCGYEYWSRRPVSNRLGSIWIGSYIKKRTHKAERQQAKDEIRGLVGESLDPANENLTKWESLPKIANV